MLSERTCWLLYSYIIIWSYPHLVLVICDVCVYILQYMRLCIVCCMLKGMFYLCTHLRSSIIHCCSKIVQKYHAIICKRVVVHWSKVLWHVLKFHLQKRRRQPHVQFPQFGRKSSSIFHVQATEGCMGCITGQGGTYRNRPKGWGNTGTPCDFCDCFSFLSLNFAML